MGFDKAFFLQMQPNFFSRLKLMWHPMLIMLLLLIFIWLIQDSMHLFKDVLDAFNKPSYFISLRLYMCRLCLCSRIRHGNINQTQKSRSLANKLPIWSTPAPRQVAYHIPNSSKVSPSHGVTQHNWDNCFLRGDEWSKWILGATRLFHIAHTTISSSFLNFTTIYYFW